MLPAGIASLGCSTVRYACTFHTAPARQTGQQDSVPTPTMLVITIQSKQTTHPLRNDPRIRPLPPDIRVDIKARKGLACDAAPITGGDFYAASPEPADLSAFHTRPYRARADSWTHVESATVPRVIPLGISGLGQHAPAASLLRNPLPNLDHRPVLGSFFPCSLSLEGCTRPDEAQQGRLKGGGSSKLGADLQPGVCDRAGFIHLTKVHSGEKMTRLVLAVGRHCRDHETRVA